MKSIVKYFALFSIVAVASKAFIDAFMPEYEAWREKYPPAPEEPDDEISEVETIPASDLFKPDLQAFESDGKSKEV
ncbi:MAG: hypothetical protein LBN74_04400 [Prevotella sp.]|jgi:hypothetical protein|nr:hypothetical protein [Prevotella sp.]